MTRQEVEMLKDWFDLGFKRLRAKLDADGAVIIYKEVWKVQESLDCILIRLLSEAVERGK